MLIGNLIASICLEDHMRDVQIVRVGKHSVCVPLPRPRVSLDPRVRLALPRLPGVILVISLVRASVPQTPLAQPRLPGATLVLKQVLKPWQ